MKTFLTYSALKKRHGSKNRLLAISLLIVLLVAGGIGFGGKALLKKANDAKVQKVSQEAVSQLITKGTYASIKPYVSDEFLSGQITEAEYDASAKELTALKNSKVAVLNVTTDSVFGTISPKDPTTQGDYLFGFTVTLKKTGLNDYKVTNIVTDYGNKSFFEDRE